MIRDRVWLKINKYEGKSIIALYNLDRKKLCARKNNEKCNYVANT